MTYEIQESWLARAEFLEMKVADRVRYVRRNIVGRADDGGMTQPQLASAVGIPSDRHNTVVRWEKGLSEPKRYKGALAALTPYEPDDFVQGAEAGVSLRSLDARLRSLADTVDQQGEATTKTLAGLARDVRAIRRRLEPGGGQATGAPG